MTSILGFLGRKPASDIKEEQTADGIKLILKPENSTFSGIGIYIIPSDPKVSFNRNDAANLIQMLAIRFPDKEIAACLGSEISFVDCGEGLEKINCPNCNKEIPMEFWQKEMEKAYQNKFSNLNITTPCCGKISNLNNLKYTRDCCFAKFILSIQDPDESVLNEVDLLKELENKSGYNFRIIHFQ